MKVTTEKLPKSLLALDIELDRDQVEKGLDRAARQLSQKYNIPGFRKGKAPRFIVENYFGREALVEQATEDLINKSFRTALEQESIEPVGQASIENVEAGDPFHFRVLVPVAPTVTIPDYKAIKVPLEVEPISDEVVQSALDELREKHVVLKELEEPRAAHQGDQVGVRLQSFVDGEPVEEREEGAEVPVTTLVLEPGRVVDGLYAALVGVEPGQIFEAAAHMPDDHANEKVRGKDVTFGGQIETIQERIPADWDELPTLENFEGDLDALRAKTRADLESAARSVAERKVLDSFIEQLVASTEYDVPDVLVHERAHDLLHEQGAQFERYGITLDQMLQYRGKTHDEAVAELEDDAAQQLRTTLALQQVIVGEELRVSPDEINAEIDRAVQDYDEGERAQARQVLGNQMRASIASAVLDRKLRDRILLLAAGVEPAAEVEPQATPTMESPEEAEDATEPSASETFAEPTEEAVGTPAKETTEEFEGPTDSSAPTTDERATQPPVESTHEFEGPEPLANEAPAEPAEEAVGAPAKESTEEAEGPTDTPAPTTDERDTQLPAESTREFEGPTEGR